VIDDEEDIFNYQCSNWRDGRWDVDVDVLGTGGSRLLLKRINKRISRGLS
jgi:hypothetical protein